jgi:hypothetical protein
MGKVRGCYKLLKLAIPELANSKATAGCQPATRVGNPPRQRPDTLSKASTWPLLAPMNRSRSSRVKARKGERLVRANLGRLSVIRDGPI